MHGVRQPIRSTTGRSPVPLAVCVMIVPGHRFAAGQQGERAQPPLTRAIDHRSRLALSFAKPEVGNKETREELVPVG